SPRERARARHYQASQRYDPQCDYAEQPHCLARRRNLWVEIPRNQWIHFAALPLRIRSQNRTSWTDFRTHRSVVSRLFWRGQAPGSRTDSIAIVEWFHRRMDTRNDPARTVGHKRFGRVLELVQTAWRACW